MLTGALMLSSWLAPLGVLSDASIVEVEVVASSRSGAARQALDDLYRSAWCPSSRDRVATLEIVFDRPVAITRVELRTEMWRKPARLPTRIDVLRDEETMSVDAEIDEHGGEVELGGAPLTTLRVRATGGERCVPELLFFVGDTYLQPIHGLEPPALHALPSFVLALGRSLSANDERALARHVRFPLRWDYNGADIYDEETRFETTRFANAAALIQHRRGHGGPDFHDFDAGTERWQRLVRALRSVYVPAPGTLVVATGQGGNVQWQLVWDEGRWRVERLYDNAYHSMRR